MRFIVILISLMTWASACVAQEHDITGTRYEAPADWVYQGQTELANTGLQPVGKISLTGGRYWQSGTFDIAKSGRYVLDFKNTAGIGHFRHIVLDEKNLPLLDTRGGIQSGESNPFLLRHGREIELASGHYRLLTELESPFFLAEPQPYIDSLDSYRSNIKLSTALTFLCLGLFLGLMVYYTAIAYVRKRLSEVMYALFILGNFLFNGTALLVFSDLFGVRWIYLISASILISNCAYMVFVMSLLDIRRQNHPRLYKVGRALLTVMTGMVVLALVKPNWSLELARYGVGIFLPYGLAAGLVCARQGMAAARFYLGAIGVFFVLGVFTISATRGGGSMLFIEHWGLLSVTVEIMLLALVLSYQFAELQLEKERAVAHMEQSTRVAHTDALTGLPNRLALTTALEALPPQGSLTFIDLDGLKFYNDRFGHARGDELLRDFAGHLKQQFGMQATAHRLGGDEFAITNAQGDSAWVVKVIELAVQATWANGFEFAGASFGTVHMHESSDHEEIKRLADQRMYEHKRQRRETNPSGTHR